MIDGEKWMHWGCVLEVELMDFANRLYGKDEGGRGDIKDNNQDF